ncbi:MAG: single-stranded DNA-binding protein [Candidatus Marinimicrobia bacterium]|nr:single-stranded DNA-binding protein [Candidatus Neomarinimicrobiota bacterium]
MEKSSLNKVILIGRVGDKPEGRYTSGGKSTSSFSIATNETWGIDDNRQEHTEWHNIVAWGKLAEFSSDYLQKGQLICIEGKLRTRVWKDKEENSRKTTEIVADRVTPLEWKGKKSSVDTEVSDADDDEEELPF